MLSISSSLATPVMVLSLALPALAFGQEAPPTPTATTPPQAAAPTPQTAIPRVLPAGAVVELALTKEVGSKLSKRGDRFGIRLAQDLKLDGVVVLPAGIEGEGEVVHAAPGKMGGGPGELLLAARFLDHGGQRVPLKALKMGSAGKDNADNALIVSMIAGPFALFVQGGEVVIPAGTLANAKLAADLPAPAPISNP